MLWNSELVGVVPKAVLWNCYNVSHLKCLSHFAFGQQDEYTLCSSILYPQPSSDEIF